MSNIERMAPAIREKIISEPDVILEDADLMQALMAASDRLRGDNVVDMRGLALDRMQTRLDRLENTHQSVIAAAYDNLAGTQQIHRAILRLLDPMSVDGFFAALSGEVSDVLRVDTLSIFIESDDTEEGRMTPVNEVLNAVAPGFVQSYLKASPEAPARQVTLRRVKERPNSRIRSEACLRLDFGEGHLPGLLVLGSTNPEQFNPAHGTDLLAFFTGVFERSMRRWLS